ncbi:unnamed protein product [Lactuca virosa]|uniref:Uncharacterized protein n=1 Tax=Lactuca virosa TaxID=75947 RepID=A0AAU9MLM4_9ASTR|nr:unnamed protein product [Lactuca virosa]
MKLQIFDLSRSFQTSYSIQSWLLYNVALYSRAQSVLLLTVIPHFTNQFSRARRLAILISHGCLFHPWS